MGIVAPHRLVLGLVAILLAPIFAGCLGVGGPDPDVVASFYPLGYVAERIAGDLLVVDTAVPAGVEPHAWEPGVRDVARIADAQILLAQGLGLDTWVDTIGRNLGSDGPRLVVTTDGLDSLIEEHDEEEGAEEGHADDEEAHEEEADHGHAHDEGEPVDPHTWLDPLTLAAQAGVVAQALSDTWPEHADTFGQNLAHLRADLEDIDIAYLESLDGCAVSVVIANHDAYGYLERRYGFTVEAVSGLSPEAEPSARTMDRLAKLAEEHDIDIVFMEELADPRVIEVLANEVGAEVRVLSPIEGLTPEQRAAGEDLLSLMHKNRENLADAMRCTEGAS